MPSPDPNPRHAESPETRHSLLENIVAGGDRWDEFDRTYRPVMVAMARQSGLDHHDAQDAVQEAFATLHRQLGAFRHGGRVGSFRRYLRRVVQSRAVDHLRQAASRATSVPIDASDDASTPPLRAGGAANPLGEAEFADAVDRAMAALTRTLRNRDRAVLEHYYLKEWPAARVAEAFRLTAANVHQIARRHKLALYREVLRQLDR